MSGLEKVLVIKRKKVVLTLAGAAAFLLLAYVACQVIRFETGHGSLGGIIHAFDLNGENNIPSYFSTIILLISAFLLYVIATRKKISQDIYSLHWKVLSAIFFFMSLDEAASIHELLISVMGKLFHASGIFYFGWVLVGIPLVIVFTIAYLKFLFHLPMKWRISISISGILYVSGALGMEMVGGSYLSRTGVEDFTYSMMVLVEESLENIGIILFISALLGYIQSYLPETAVRVE